MRILPWILAGLVIAKDKKKDEKNEEKEEEEDESKKFHLPRWGEEGKKTDSRFWKHEYGTILEAFGQNSRAFTSLSRYDQQHPVNDQPNQQNSHSRYDRQRPV